MATKKKQRQKQSKNKKGIPPQKKTAGTRFTVDDPVNDVHDDELYDDETGLRKENTEVEEFERPW